MVQTPFPVSIGFVADRETWDHVMNEYGIKGRPYPEFDACCTEFEATSHDESNRDFTLVTVHERMDDRDDVDEFLVHEAVHCFQFLCNVIGEPEHGGPSREFEAYTIQFIFRFLRNAYRNTRHGKKASKSSKAAG